MNTETGYLARCAARVLADETLTAGGTRNVVSKLINSSPGDELAPPPGMAEALKLDWAKPGAADAFATALAGERKPYIAKLCDIAASSGTLGSLEANVATLSRQLGLAEPAQAIILLLAAYRTFEAIEEFSDTVHSLYGSATGTLAMLLGLPRHAISRWCESAAGLKNLGLLRMDRERSHVAGEYGRYDLPGLVYEVLTQDYATDAEFARSLIGSPAVTPLTAEDFTHVGDDLRIAAAILREAARRRLAGTNILIYGPPGTGKSEFAKVAAAIAGVPLLIAGERMATEAEPGRDERRSQLALLSGLLSNMPSSAILFDELEDIARDLIRRGGSKAQLNRQIEQNPVPIVWTANNLEAIDPAVIRRMTFTVALEKPSRRHRERLWKDISGQHDAGLSATDCARLAGAYDATPATIRNALQISRLAGGSLQTIEHAVSSQMRALDCDAIKPQSDDVAFEPKIALADCDLAALTKKLQSKRVSNFSLLLSGPPGTGKSAYARHLAAELGLEVLQVRVSDLFGAYVGQTEKAIAAAFREAARERLFLIFDEADSLLMNRRDASRSWEITQVNEMLTWMERHPWPFCCTTNLVERLDPASLRRFVFNIRFRALDQAGLQSAWSVFFGQEIVAPPALFALSNLTPGDFALVHRRLEILGECEDSRAIVGGLEEASLAKPGASGVMGFNRLHVDA